jgi:hypothetical protein
MKKLHTSSIGLIVSNLIVIGLAVWQGWDFSVVIWGYWAQSVIIGLFHAKRMVSLKKFSVEGMNVNGVPVKPTMKAKKSAASFFLLHYGIFHFVYLVFLIILAWPEMSAWGSIGLFALVFFVNHAITYKFTRKKDDETGQHLGKLFFLPYPRILPMHLIVILGLILGKGMVGMVFFLLVKTVADVITDGLEEKMG